MASGKYVVSIIKGNNPPRMLKRAIALCGGMSDTISKTSKAILIKPNFGCHKNAATGATTDLRVLASLIETLQSEGYSNIVVGDGGMAAYIKIKILDYLGVRSLCKKYGVPVVDLNYDKGVSFKLRSGATVKVSKTALESSVIDLAKLKTHVLTTVTLGIKNLMGCVVGFDKREVHLHGLHESLADLPLIVKPCLTIVEGLIGMEGRGPVAGKPIKSNVLVASKNVVAADIIASKIMGCDPLGIRHIRQTMEAVSIKNIDEIKIVGSPLGNAITPFEQAVPEMLEANSYVNLLKHLIRGSPLYYSASTILSSNIGSTLFRHLGILQEEVDRDLSLRSLGVNAKTCIGCSLCINICPTEAISLVKGKANLAGNKCVRCGCCVEICPHAAIIHITGQPVFPDAYDTGITGS